MKLPISDTKLKQKQANVKKSSNSLDSNFIRLKNKN